MNQEDILKQSKNIILKLKSKVSGDLSNLVDSLSLMIEMIISLCDKQSEQIANQSKQIESQTKLIEKQNASIDSLTENIKELKRQLGLNSSNSSKLPSTNGFTKPKRNISLRTKSTRTRGGQNGLKGASLCVPHEVDEVVEHIPNKSKDCPCLKKCLASGRVLECTESRYVIKAKVVTEVIEHQSLKAINCPKGSNVKPGEFPSNVKAYVQYDDSIAILAGQLNTKGAVSLIRVQELLNALCGIKISTGTLYNMVYKCAKKVEQTMETEKIQVTKVGVVHVDETGIRSEGKLLWVHNSSTDRYTYQIVSQKKRR